MGEIEESCELDMRHFMWSVIVVLVLDLVVVTSTHTTLTDMLVTTDTQNNLASMRRELLFSVAYPNLYIRYCRYMLNGAYPATSLARKILGMDNFNVSGGGDNEDKQFIKWVKRYVFPR